MAASQLMLEPWILYGTRIEEAVQANIVANSEMGECKNVTKERRL